MARPCACYGRVLALARGGGGRHSSGIAG
jgi:hypothetical protein